METIKEISQMGTEHWRDYCSSNLMGDIKRGLIDLNPAGIDDVRFRSSVGIALEFECHPDVIERCKMPYWSLPYWSEARSDTIFKRIYDNSRKEKRYFLPESSQFEIVDIKQNKKIVFKFID